MQLYAVEQFSKVLNRSRIFLSIISSLEQLIEMVTNLISSLE